MLLPSAESLQGKAVPQVTFKTRSGGQSHDVTSDTLFKGKTVVVFALPGAYTPTCSTSHLPRYNELAKVIRANGIDDIICISVNDPFVMDEWGRGQAADQVTMIPDGNGEFTEGMGLLVDKRALGLGQRSWRYSMLVRDGIVDTAFIERFDDNDPDGDPFEVSDADTMLRHIAPTAKAPEPVVMFSKPGCPYCARAKAILKARGIAFTDISQDGKITGSVLRAVSGATTWPQVFEGGRLIGGSEEIAAYFGPAPVVDAAQAGPGAGAQA